MNAGFPVFLLSLFCCLLQSAKELQKVKSRQEKANPGQSGFSLLDVHFLKTQNKLVCSAPVWQIANSTLASRRAYQRVSVSNPMPASTARR
jgi:hypothetical protein